jgi:RNA polymerase sigma factor (sigma-70 family)
MSIEKQLVDACIREERVAQRQFYELYAGKLYAIAIRYLKDRDDAQDVLQDGFVKIYKNLGSFRWDCPLEAWIKRIVINTALKAIQKKSQMQLTDINNYTGELDNNPINLGLENLKLETLNGLINSLPDGCRTIFNLYAVEGYKHNEIAEMLGVTEGTSKSQFSRARQLMIEKLERDSIKILTDNNQ